MKYLLKHIIQQQPTTSLLVGLITAVVHAVANPVAHIDASPAVPTSDAQPGLATRVGSGRQLAAHERDVVDGGAARVVPAVLLVERYL